MNDWVWWQKAVEALFTLLGGLGVVGLGWFVGLRLTAKWNVRQKRRELELTTLDEFYKLYGEFFAVWKLWNAYKGGLAAPAETHWNLLERAAAIDGRMEAMLIKVTSERQFTKETLNQLGLMRQGFQRLRGSIKRNERLDWYYSEHEEYSEIKRLASLFSTLLVSERAYDIEGPGIGEANNAFRRVTANEREGEWQAIMDKEKAKLLPSGE